MPPNYAAQYINSWLAGVGVQQRAQQLELQKQYYSELAQKQRMMDLYRDLNYDLRERNMQSLIDQRDRKATMQDQVDRDVGGLTSFYDSIDPSAPDAEQQIAQGLAKYPNALFNPAGRWLGHRMYTQMNTSRVATRNNYMAKERDFQNYFDNEYGKNINTDILDSPDNWHEQRVDINDPNQQLSPTDPRYLDPKQSKGTGKFFTGIPYTNAQGQPDTYYVTRPRKQLQEDLRRKAELAREASGLQQQVAVPELGVDRQPEFSAGSGTQIIQGRDGHSYEVDPVNRQVLRQVD